jgi:hypothetical protein
MRLSVVLALCVISAAIGAAVDHYWTDALLLLRPRQAPSAEPTTSPRSQEKVEVLGDRVRCDVRFTDQSPNTGHFLTHAWEVPRPLTDAEPVQLITS